MKNIVKKFDRIGLMVLLAAFFLAVGFKAAEKMENAPAWYEVEITDLNFPDLPENQKIIDAPIAPPTGECDIRTGTLCAIELDLAPGSSAPEFVSDAETMKVTTGNRRHKN